MMPGMVDTHIHAPQFPNLGIKLDLPLLQWLESYTFPTEASFSAINVAKDVYPKVVVGVYFFLYLNVFFSGPLLTKYCFSSYYNYL